MAAGAALALWITLAFVLALRTGWVHVFLAAGVLAAVHRIVSRDAETGGHGRS